MSAPDIGTILKVPGRLSINCTDLTLPWPHGGTGLGLCKNIAMKPGRAWQKITEESFAEVEDILDLGESWTLGALLRSDDPDTLQKVFCNTSAGTATGKPVVFYPGTFRAGTLRSQSAVSVIFTPDDDEKHRFLVLYKALPLVDESAELRLQMDEELNIPLIFVAIRDAVKGVMAWGFKGDLTL